MTYGQIRMRIVKACPGVDPELIDGWIQDRYTEILDSVPWKRMEGESAFQSPASVIAGTVTATQGSPAIVGVGTAWTVAMDGLMIRIANGTEFYIFTFVDATHATLDRDFEQVGAASLAYRIDQAVFPMPASCAIVRGVRALHNSPHIALVTPAELNRLDPQRTVYGTPTRAAATWDSYSDPPLLQLEFNPIPSSPDSVGNTLSFIVDYIFDAAGIDPTQTGVDLLPWTRPQAIIEGVMASIDRWRASSDKSAAGAYINAATAHETQFTKLLKTMAQRNALQRGPQPIQLSPELKRQTPGMYRKGPWRRGFTG
jgi:hypothetical protein